MVKNISCLWYLKSFVLILIGLGDYSAVPTLGTIIYTAASMLWKKNHTNETIKLLKIKKDFLF